MTFDAVFFDFGGVILTSPFEAFTAYEQRAGLPSDAIRTINSTNPDSNAWARLERSELELSEFVEEFEREAAALGFDGVSGAEVLACLAGEVRPAMAEAVGRCAERFTTALLTNNVASMSTDGAHRFDAVLAHFDHIIESSVVGVRKPEPAFYAIACERAGVSPARVVFLDDLGVNLKPARAMGMTTIKVVDPDRAIAELAELVGIQLR